MTLFNTDENGIINKKGELSRVQYVVHKEYQVSLSKFRDGVAVVSLYREEEDKNNYSSRDRYEGLLNVNGEMIIDQLIYKEIDEFKNGRSFAQDGDRDYFLINTKGEKVTMRPFNRRLKVGFQNGLALVEKEWKHWGIIDTNGVFVLPAQYRFIDEVGIIDDYFFFGIHDETTDDKYDKIFGIATIYGDTVLAPMMSDFSKQGFQNGLLVCKIKGKYTYINRKGEIIRQEQKAVKPIKEYLNLDYMNRGYFNASSIFHPSDLGLFGKSSNSADTILDEVFPENKLSLIVDTKIDTIQEKYYSSSVFLVNNTDTTFYFNAQDSRLYMKVQALDKNGIWRDIEYLPSSWCGNSYHTLTLHPNEFWSFYTPIYKGDFKTKLRIEAKYIAPRDIIEQSDTEVDEEEEEIFEVRTTSNAKEITIYSNEYEGSINPAQFWRKPDYDSRNLMNPYNE